jgi:hypothetical protein
MKRIITSALLILFISCASFGLSSGEKLVAEGKSFSTMGSFRIETSTQPVVVNGVALDTYVITYENTDMNLVIAVEKKKDCQKYIAITDHLSVQYVCNGAYFGVEKLTMRNAVNGITTNDDNLDRSAYFHQKVLTNGAQDQIYYLKLIGAFFPELVKKASMA